MKNIYKEETQKALKEILDTSMQKKKNNKKNTYPGYALALKFSL